MTIRIVYPLEAHETAESATFFVGSVPPKSTLLINNEAVAVSASGYFSHRVTLQDGENIFLLQSGDETRQRKVTKRVASPLIGSFFKDRPPQLQCNLNYPVSILKGETFQFWVQLPEGISASLSLAGHAPIPLTAVGHVQNKPHVFGYPYQETAIPSDSVVYTAILDTTSWPNETTLTAELTVSLGQQVQYVTLAGEVTVWTHPRHARIISNQAITRSAPLIGARQTPQLKDTILEITRIQDNWAYSSSANLWLALADLQLSETSLMLVPNQLRSIHADASDIQLYSDTQIPVAIEVTPSQVFLTFTQTISCCDLIRVTESANYAGIEAIRSAQISETQTRVQINLSSPLMGYTLTYHNESRAYTLTLKTGAQLSRRPIRVLIDAGHGGDELGAMSPDGQAEKDLNLNLATQLALALGQHSNFDVKLTRDSDHTQSLESRLQQSLDWDADIFLSLHHNALPDGRDPQQECGLVTFYYHAFSQPFAQHLQSTLLAQSDFPDYGVSQNSLAMCRQSHCLSLLLELGFLTHPEDAERCLSPQAQVKLIKALAEAIFAYISCL